LTFETYFQIIDSKIKSILLYSSEVWGLHKLDSIEKVHKRFLGVPICTPNNMIYGDLGRYPLYRNSSINTIRYWLKLHGMDQNRLPHQAYKMLLELDFKGKKCWVSNVRDILCETGFGIVWLQQSIGDIKMFLNVFKQRLVDMFIQSWSGVIRDRDRYTEYRTFKAIFEREKYLSNIDVYCFRVALTQAWFNVLPLNNNLHRYSPKQSDRNCPFCKNCIENEHHLFFSCALYVDLRVTFLHSYHWFSTEHSPLRELCKQLACIYIHFPCCAEKETYD
jgi:hypothetical protein